MRKSVGSKTRRDPLVKVAGILFGAFLYLAVRVHIDGALPEHFEESVPTLLR